MIEISHLTKKYGTHVAVNDLSLTIEPGRIYGFLGPNGAGKSTTMNIMTGYLAPTEGTVLINGFDIYRDALKAKACIGYLPEIPPLYQDMTVLEYLDYAAGLKKIPKAQRNDAVTEACITAGISDVASRLIRNLSKGYKQRVGIAQAILGKPEIIILDEPTVGLDPAQIIEIRDLIAELGKDHTVILSSHILTEVSAVCSYIYILSNGKLVASDTTENLLTQMKGRMEIEVVVQGKADASIFEQIDGVEEVEILPSLESDSTRMMIYGSTKEDLRPLIFNTAVKNNLILLKFNAISRSLEDVFLELTASENDVDADSEISEADTDFAEADNDTDDEMPDGNCEETSENKNNCGGEE